MEPADFLKQAMENSNGIPPSERRRAATKSQKASFWWHGPAMAASNSSNSRLEQLDSLDFHGGRIQPMCKYSDFLAAFQVGLWQNREHLCLTAAMMRKVLASTHTLAMAP